MRVVFTILILSLFYTVAKAQHEDIPITIGYLGSFGVQPGLRVGTLVSLKDLSGKESGKKTNTIFLSPLLGGFTYPGNFNAFVINADVGYKTQHSKSGLYHAFSVGAGFLTQFRIVSWSVNIATGDKAKQRTTELFILPVINYEIGQGKRGKLNWYTKLSYGRKLSFNAANSPFAAIEIGTRIYINKA